MSTSLIVKIVSFLKSGQWVSENDTYNKSVYGFSKAQLKLVDKAMVDLYGMRFNWPNKVNAVKLQERVNEL